MNTSVTIINEPFLVVPETVLPNGTVVRSFKVARYVASDPFQEENLGIEKALPWVDITYEDAREACEEMGGSLITETQWLAIAHDVAHQDCNWTGGKVGVGDLFQGLRNSTVSSAQSGDYVSPDASEQRWLTLSNGEKICDLNGNVYQWVFYDLEGDKKGLSIKNKLSANSATISTPQFRSGQNGIGTYPKIGTVWDAAAIARGGSWKSGFRVGAFHLDGYHNSDSLYYDERSVRFYKPSSRSDIGFRCAKHL